MYVNQDRTITTLVCHVNVTLMVTPLLVNPMLVVHKIALQEELFYLDQGLAVILTVVKIHANRENPTPHPGTPATPVPVDPVDDQLAMTPVHRTTTVLPYVRPMISTLCQKTLVCHVGVGMMKDPLPSALPEHVPHHQPVILVKFFYVDQEAAVNMTVFKVHAAQESHTPHPETLVILVHVALVENQLVMTTAHMVNALQYANLEIASLCPRTLAGYVPVTTMDNQI